MLQLLACLTLISILISCETLNEAQQNADKFCNCATDISNMLNRMDSVEYLSYDSFNINLSAQTVTMQNCLKDNAYLETSVVIEDLNTIDAIAYDKDYLSYLKDNCPNVANAFNL